MATGRDWAWIVIAYLAAAAAATLAIQLELSDSTLWQAAIADVAATLVIFAFGWGFRNSSFYDAYWSVVPPVLMGYWMWAHQAMDWRLIILFVLVTLWAVRLTANWGRGWHGLTHQDWRYIDLKEKTGPFFRLVDLFGIQLMPTALVFLGCLPIWFLVQFPRDPFTAFDLIWIVIGFAAVYLEFRADNVLRRFRLDPANAGQVLREDVWAWCRHPNYLGELGFWLAIAIAGVVGGAPLYSTVGFFAMLALFLGASIPMIDTRQLANKPAYAEYKAAVPSLIPRRPRA